MIEGVAVVVPARDEEASIAGCLRAVRAALPPGLPAAVCVVLDRCADRTADQVPAYADVLVNEADLALGAVRDLGSRAALSTLAAAGLAPERCWLLSTDADSAVPADWVASHLALADRGAEAVAGPVEILDWAGFPEQVRLRYLSVAGDPAIEHVYGANLGVRGDAYLAVGGFAPISTGEDQELWDRLTAAGVRTAVGASGAVLTSSRRHGRARGGVADLLDQLCQEPPGA